MTDDFYLVSDKQLQQLINVSSVDERKIIVREIKKHEVSKTFFPKSEPDPSDITLGDLHGNVG